MKSLYADLFRRLRDLNFQMEVLEHFEWDEEAKDVFIADLEKIINSSENVEDLKNKLSDNYSVSLIKLTCDLIKGHEKDLIDDSKGDKDIAN